MVEDAGDIPLRLPVEALRTRSSRIVVGDVRQGTSHGPKAA